MEDLVHRRLADDAAERTVARSAGFSGEREAELLVVGICDSILSRLSRIEAEETGRREEPLTRRRPPS